METNFSKTSLLKFLDNSTKQGVINANTAAGRRAAATRLLEDVGSDEDVRNVDVEAAAIKYHNKHPGELNTDSLRIYKRRLEKLLVDFKSYSTDPLNFKHRSRGLPKANGTRAKQRTESERVGSNTANTPETGAMEFVSTGATTTGSTTMALPLSYPLRENFMAQVVVPRNINSDEARRLCAFIMTLPADFKPQG
jgi:hypothetical protein